MLEWLTDPNVMAVSDQIEKVNRKMFEKLKSRNDNLAVFFCKYNCVHIVVHNKLRYVSFKKIETLFFSFKLLKKTANNVLQCSKNWKISMMKLKQQVRFIYIDYNTININPYLCSI